MDRLQRTGYNCFIIVVLIVAHMLTDADSNWKLDGYQRCAGRVEYLNGTRVCNNEQNMKKAEKLCVQLDCAKLVATGKSSFDSSSNSKNPCPGGDGLGVVCEGGFHNPGITLSSSKVKWGDSLEIRCSVPSQIHALVKGEFTLHGQLRDTTGSVSEEPEEKKSLATFTVLNVNFEDAGKFECCYDPKTVKPVCNSVVITVTLDLQEPSISVSSDEQPMALNQTQVTRGYRFVIVCSTLAAYPEGHFLLWFPASNSSVRMTAVNHSASFDYPQCQYEQQGQYYCVYEVTRAGRTYISPPSAVVQVTVKEPLLPLILAAVAVSLVLLVLTGVYCYYRRRRRNAVVTDVAATTQSPMTRNRYISDGEEEEEEEEEDYVNVPSRGNGKEEDEQLEESDDEPCYVNVTVSRGEMTLDIYGGDDNIYQNY